MSEGRVRRTRERAAEGRGQNTKSAVIGRRGRSGLAEATKESERIKMKQETSRNSPWRFWLKSNEEAEIVILDESIDDAFFLYEHAIKSDNGQWGREFQPCVKETESCPLCQAAENNNGSVSRSYYAMVLSIADLRGFTTKAGEVVNYSKKLLAIKGTQINAFVKILETAEKNNKTLRGTYLVLHRGSDQNAASTGTPIPLDNGMVYELWDEDAMFDELEHDDITDDKGKVIKEANADMFPYEYDKIFKAPNVAALSKIYGGKNPTRAAGSQADIDKEWDEDEEDEVEEEKPQRTRRRAREEEPRRTSRTETKTRRRAEPQEDPEEEPPARVRERKRSKPQEAEEEAAPTRSRRAGRNRPSKAEEYDIDEDEIPF